MKVQEIINKELYENLLKCQPDYYFGLVGTPEQTTIYAENLFNQIYELLIPFNPKLKPNFYHLNKEKDKIELWAEKWIPATKGKKRRQDDWIEIYANGGSVVKGNAIDPETVIKTRQELINTMKDW